MNYIVYVMFVHFLGDFVFQSREMATNKSSSLFWLTAHVMMYGCILLVGLTFIGLIPGQFPVSQIDLMTYVFANMGLHFMIDFVTSKLSSKFWKNGQTHKFFMVIGFDQFLHFTSLYLTLKIFF